MSNFQRVLLFIGVIFLAVGLCAAGAGVTLLAVPAVDNFMPGLILLLIGLSFATPGAIIVALPLLRKRKLARLMRDGACIKAAVTEVRQNTFFTLNDRHPYIIECSWQDRSGTTYIFRSPNIWEDPLPLLNSNNVTMLPVYYDKNNMKNYAVDISVLDKYSKGKIVRL